LQECIHFIEENQVYHNHELYSNIINLNNSDFKIIINAENINYLSNFQNIPKIYLKIKGLFEFIKNEFALPTEVLDLYDNNTLNINISNITNTSILSFTLTNNDFNNDNITNNLKLGLLEYIKYIIKEL
jgi:hypothetical protein